MKQKFISSIFFMAIAFICNAQRLDTFSTTIVLNESGKSEYLSISLKKALPEKEAISNKNAIDIVLISTQDGSNQTLQWYNMSGKDNKISKELIGTATGINAISFDKEQFEKCKTNADLVRMTGYITKNSFSHFASITDNINQGIKYHCFIIQMENGKRALLWLDAIDATHFKVIVKMQV